MKPASARTSRAPAPRKSGNPEPVSLAPAGRSRIPSAEASSQWGFGVKSNAPGSPQLRTTRLALASPSGTSGAGKLGRVSARRSSSTSISRSSWSSVLTCSPDALSVAINSSAGSLARFRRATSSLAAFRSALSASTRTSSSRRRRSSSSTSATKAATAGSLRRSRLARLPSGS